MQKKRFLNTRVKLDKLDNELDFLLRILFHKFDLCWCLYKYVSNTLQTLLKLRICAKIRESIFFLCYQNLWPKQFQCTLDNPPEKSIQISLGPTILLKIKIGQF